MKRKGALEIPERDKWPLMYRLLPRINKRAKHGCWAWRGTLCSSGYGVASYKGRQEMVHRLVHMVETGPIPEGYHVDHLCGVRHCVNPKHLEAVTPKVNARRAVGSDAPEGMCASGLHKHEEGSYRVRKNNRIECLACEKARAERRKAAGENVRAFKRERASYIKMIKAGKLIRHKPDGTKEVVQLSEYMQKKCNDYSEFRGTDPEVTQPVYNFPEFKARDWGAPLRNWREKQKAEAQARG